MKSVLICMVCSIPCIALGFVFLSLALTPANAGFATGIIVLTVLTVIFFVAGGGVFLFSVLMCVALQLEKKKQQSAGTAPQKRLERGSRLL